MLSSRSRRLGWLSVALTSFASSGCETQKDRIEELCAVLADCTGYLGGRALDCPGEIEDALRDRRLSQAALTKCASCLNANSDITEDTNKFDDCRGLFLERACDTACEDVALVRNARTSAAMRLEACTVVSNACTLADCREDYFPKTLATLAEAQAADRTIADCVACVASVPPSNDECAVTADAGKGGSAGSGACASAGAGGMSGAAGTGGVPGAAGSSTAGADAAAGSAGRSDSKLDSERCARLVERCSTGCVGVAAIDKRLTLAAATTKYCGTPRSCPTGSNGTAGATPPEATAGAAGSAGTSGTAGAAGTAGTSGTAGAAGATAAAGCLPEPQTDRCFEQTLECGDFHESAAAINAKDPRDCLGCLDTSMCSESCDTCEQLYSRDATARSASSGPEGP